MNTRIRYKKLDANGELVSKNLFLHESNGARFQIVLNVNKLEFTIKDEVCNGVVAQGMGNSLHSLKKNAKAALEKLGIPFVNEDRAKKHVEVTN